jgi:hypothetical protein
MTEQHRAVQGSLSEKGFHVHIIKTMSGEKKKRKHYVGTGKANSQNLRIKTGIPLLTRHI